MRRVYKRADGSFVYFVKEKDSNIMKMIKADNPFSNNLDQSTSWSLIFLFKLSSSWNKYNLNFLVSKPIVDKTNIKENERKNMIAIIVKNIFFIIYLLFQPQ